MNNYNFRNNDEYQTVFSIDPYVYETLQSIVNSNVAFETGTATYKGTLVDVKPDHVVIQEMGTNRLIFIRIKEIVSIIPIN